MQRGGLWQEKRVGRSGNSRYGEIGAVGSTKAGSREPDIGTSLTRTTKRSFHSDSLGRTVAHVTNSCEAVPTARIEVTSSTTWREDNAANWNEYAAASYPKYRAAVRNRWKTELRDTLLWYI